MRDRRAAGDMQRQVRGELDESRAAQHSGPPHLRRSSPIIPAILISLMGLCVVLYIRLDTELEDRATETLKSRRIALQMDDLV